MEFLRTFIPALVFALTLSGCQTVGIDQDPDRSKKLALVTTTIMVDAVGVYGHLPVCDRSIPQPLGCQEVKRYSDAKLIAQLVAQDYQGSSPLLGLGLIYAQWQLSKTIAGTPGPTNPNAPPNEQTTAYLHAIGLADILISTADQRVRDAVSVNTSVAELQAKLQASVAALP